MPKYEIAGSGGSGAGWIGKVYFATSKAIYETEDSQMIALLEKSGLARLIIEKIPVIASNPVDELSGKTYAELVAICKEMKLDTKGSKDILFKRIITELKG